MPDCLFYLIILFSSNEVVQSQLKVATNYYCTSLLNLTFGSIIITDKKVIPHWDFSSVIFCTWMEKFIYGFIEIVLSFDLIGLTTILRNLIELLSNNNKVENEKKKPTVLEEKVSEEKP